MVSVVAGGGDNAAGAVGMGMYRLDKPCCRWEHLEFFSVSDGFTANPAAASQFWTCYSKYLAYYVGDLECRQLYRLGHEAHGFFECARGISTMESHQGRFHSVTFLPYLSGERTPHNDPNAKGVFTGHDP